MTLGTLSAIVGLGFISASLLFIQSSASYSADAAAGADTQPSGKVVIPAAVLPPFDPAATRITESNGTLIVLLETGATRQDLHILAHGANQSANRNVNAVEVFHAKHGQLMTLRLDEGCRGNAAAPDLKTAGRRSMPACGRFAA